MENRVHGTSRSFSLLILAATLVLSLDAQGQSQPSVEVNLGLDSIMPGDLAHIPLVLFAAGIKVGRVAGEVTFPKKVVSFDKAIRGQAGDEADAKVTAEVLNDSRESDLSTLRIVISATKEIPKGVLLDLRFKVFPDAKPGTTLQLRNSLRAVTVEGEEIKDVKRTDGELNIFIMPAVDVTCFFFTH